MKRKEDKAATTGASSHAAYIVHWVNLGVISGCLKVEHVCLAAYRRLKDVYQTEKASHFLFVSALLRPFLFVYEI